MKDYKAVFFDWDGTAVTSRSASPEDVVVPMKKLLDKGISLVIVSGTTYENIAGGKLHEYFTPSQLKNLFLGLGRGAFNYKFDEKGQPYVWKNTVPEIEKMLKIHDACYALHRELLREYSLPSDIVFSRPNYCKIDILVGLQRGEQLYFQGSDLEDLYHHFRQHNYMGGLPEMMQRCRELGLENGVSLAVTSDAKYIEAGLTDKSDNVNSTLALLEQEKGITASQCCFWGDEFIRLDEGIYGSDSYMLTENTSAGDFFDVSGAEGVRPENIKVLGGGVATFIEFLNQLAE